MRKYPHFFTGDDDIDFITNTCKESLMSKLINKIKGVIKMISRRSFEKGDFRTRYDDINKHPVVIFLRNNKDKAFKAKEIAKAVKINENTIRGALAKARRNKLVEHKQPYFIIKN